MKDNLFELYTLAELSYINQFKNISDDLFPEQWYENTNYKVKIEIMSEAIKTNTLIVNTQAYLKIVEGVDTKVRNLLK